MFASEKKTNIEGKRREIDNDERETCSNDVIAMVNHDDVMRNGSPSLSRSLSLIHI